MSELLPKNIVFKPEDARLKPDGTPYEMRIHDFFKSLIVNTAMANPQWVFNQESAEYTTDGRAAVTHFSLKDSKAPYSFIGEIAMSTRRSPGGVREKVYAVRSKRLSRERERGSWHLTKDEKSAIKTIKKYFNPPPLTERLQEVTEKGKRLVLENHSNHHANVRTRRESTYTSIFNFTMANWDSYMNSLSDREKSEALLLVESLERFNKVKQLTNVSQNGELLTVLIESDKYILRYKEVIYVKLSEELPSDLRGVIGKLKLLPEGEAILEGEGAKVQPNCFVVMPTPEFLSEVSQMQQPQNHSA